MEQNEAQEDVVTVPEGDLRQVDSHIVLSLGVAIAFLDGQSPLLLVLGELLARGLSLTMEEEGKKKHSEKRDVAGGEKKNEKKVEISEEGLPPVHVANNLWSRVYPTWHNVLPSQVLMSALPIFSDFCTRRIPKSSRTSQIRLYENLPDS